MSDTHQYSMVKRRWTSVCQCNLCGKESHDDAAAKAHFFSEHIRKIQAPQPGRKQAAITERLEGALLVQCLDKLCDMNRVNIAANARSHGP